MNRTIDSVSVGQLEDMRLAISAISTYHPAPIWTYRWGGQFREFNGIKTGQCPEFLLRNFTRFLTRHFRTWYQAYFPDRRMPWGKAWRTKEAKQFVDNMVQECLDSGLLDIVQLQPVPITVETVNV